MRKTIAIIAALTAALLLGAFTSGWTQKQETAHQIAELARSVGLSEDHPIIAEASRLWWEDANLSGVKLELKEDGAIKVTEDYYSFQEEIAPIEAAEVFEAVEIPEIRAEDESGTPESEAKPEMIYLGTYYITGYDTCYQCCGKTDGITASGTQATAGRTIAAAGFDFGTKIYIEGIGERIVEDRGPGHGVIDVLCYDHPECYAITGYYECWEIV